MLWVMVPVLFLWYDNWHPLVPPLDHFGLNFALVSGIPLHAKVFSVLYNDLWTWPFYPAWQPFFSPIPQISDDVIWIVSSSSVYNASSTWECSETFLFHCCLVGIRLFCCPRISPYIALF